MKTLYKMWVILLTCEIFSTCVAGATTLPRDEEFLAKIQSTWTDETGSAHSLSEWRGQDIVLTTFYAQCRKTCSNLTIPKLTNLQKIFANHHRMAQFLLVTLDPENDTEAELQRYRENRHLTGLNWHFLRGSELATHRFARSIGLANYWKMDDHIVHDFRIIVLDHVVHSVQVLDMEHRNEEEILKP
jgi:cytochrome oxidase Cu insertion factor (SCO1/SenC/PrrC family)